MKAPECEFCGAEAFFLRGPKEEKLKLCKECCIADLQVNALVLDILIAQEEAKEQ